MPSSSPRLTTGTRSARSLACQAGKDVYVEKPLATTIAEGRAMVKAARRYNRIVDVGTQQRSAGHFRDAVAFVKSGKLGKIRMVRAWAYLDWKGDLGRPPDEPPPPELDYDMWLGPARQRPYNRMRVHHNFRWFWDYSGGLLTDWGAHMVDVVMWAMGEEPRGAMAIGGKYGFPDDIRETPDTQQSVIEFPSFSLVWEHMIGCGVGPWQREHGCEFHGENGILVVDRGGWEVYSETDRFKQPERMSRMMPVPRRLAAGRLPPRARQEFRRLPENAENADSRCRGRPQIHDRSAPGQHRRPAATLRQMGSGSREDRRRSRSAGPGRPGISKALGASERVMASLRVRE